jgi:hypothetical protein
MTHVDEIVAILGPPTRLTLVVDTYGYIRAFY